MTRNILEVKGLDKSFGGNRVTQNVTLDLVEGGKEAIIGPNGAGKSTFFNLLTGYHRPDKGSVTFDGIDITGWPPAPHFQGRRGARLSDQQHLYQPDGAREHPHSRACPDRAGLQHAGACHGHRH